jgi:hypothetical protein
MTSRISPEAKSARSKFRTITRETERVLDKTFNGGYPTIHPTGLEALVALGTGLPLNEVSGIVRGYMSARDDLYLSTGKNGGWRKKA